MHAITMSRRLEKLVEVNTWWHPPHHLPMNYATLQQRPFLDQLLSAMDQPDPILLQGPKGAGKTALLYGVVGQLLAQGVAPLRLCFVPADHPAFYGVALGDIVHFFSRLVGAEFDRQSTWLFLDELPCIVDGARDFEKITRQHPKLHVVATSSASASYKGGAAKVGQTLFLPPLTFPEYIIQSPFEKPFEPGSDQLELGSAEVEAFNRLFQSYIRFGGFPRIAGATDIGMANSHGKAVLDDMLLSAQPSQCGVGSTAELNDLLTLLAYNNGQEIGPEPIARLSGLAKNTVRKYLNYLQDAHLIHLVKRVSKWGGKMIRQRSFRCFLTHPCLRYLLLPPYADDEAAQQVMAANALLTQLLPARHAIFENRWEGSGIGLVRIGEKRKAVWAMEVGFSDEPGAIDGLVDFCRVHHLTSALITTHSKFHREEHRGVKLTYIPCAIQCFAMGYRTSLGRGIGMRLKP